MQSMIMSGIRAVKLARPLDVRNYPSLLLANKVNIQDVAGNLERLGNKAE